MLEGTIATLNALGSILLNTADAGGTILLIGLFGAGIFGIANWIKGIFKK